MSNLIVNIVGVSSAIIISVFVKSILIYNYYDINDKYILDSMRSE